MRRILTACILVISLLIGPALTARADLAVDELPLTPGGKAFEIHADGQERLWISDYQRGELWRVTANGGTVQVYSVGGQPSDATPDAYGSVWWVSGGSLYRMDAASGHYTFWDILTTPFALWSVELDYQGKVWVNDDTGGTLYRFDPWNSELCAYPLKTLSQGYLAVSANQVWVGDSSDSKIFRLDPGSDTLSWWSLPTNHTPFDLAPDGSGAIWYTNPVGTYASGFGGIGRLDPVQNQVTEYSLPSGYGTKMLTTIRGKVWYSGQQSDQIPSTFGRLDPAQAAGSSFSVDRGSSLITPGCSNPSPSGSGYAGMSGGHSWAGSTSYPSLVDSGGWKVYQLPDTAIPMGLAMTYSGWLVDSGRNRLAHFDAGIPPLGHIKVYIPLALR